MEATTGVFLLLVTWFTMTGPSSYQVEFEDQQRCEAAAAALFKEQDRMKAQVAQAPQTPPGNQPPGMEAMAMLMGPMMQSVMQGMAQPSVSAVCVER